MKKIDYNIVENFEVAILFSINVPNLIKFEELSLLCLK